MIPNAVAVAVGIWLAYSAIFSTPGGAMNNTHLTVAAILILVCGLAARFRDRMRWPSATNIAFGLILGLLAGARAFAPQAHLASFWIILLSGIAVSITALWSILYRPGHSADAAPP